MTITHYLITAAVVTLTALYVVSHIAAVVQAKYAAILVALP